MKKTILLIFVILAAIVFTPSCNYINDAKDTAFDEFKPSALLKKYEDFKEMSAVLDKKLADLKVYESRFIDLKDQYAGVARKEWAREDREQYNLWQSEQAGIKASYNDLAAQYNADMSKWNYQFCNIGTLPQGATNPLPREYKPYIYN